MFWKKKPQPTQAPGPKRQSIFSADLSTMPSGMDDVKRRVMLNTQFEKPPQAEGAQDSSTGLVPEFKQLWAMQGVPQAQADWYMSQHFIGYPLCAVMSTHWLVDKACSMPAEDALRAGYEVKVNAEIDNTETVLKAIKAVDKKRKIKDQMREFIHFGRVFGVRHALFKVQTTDPEYYEKPFNPDAVTPGSYLGIAQIDPNFIIPMLEDGSLIDPSSIHYYNPIYYNIGGKKYHKSHFVIYVPYPVVDLLKPQYRFGGVSVPQRIYERVYAAERTANEAPILAMTKRTYVFKTDGVEFFSKLADSVARLAQWITVRDNQGALVVDKEGEELTQLDTSLADFDALMMNQYQLASSCANVPATKLLGTTPKGFNATGEGEAEDYRIFLESIQSHAAQPLLERHHLLSMRSDIAPVLGMKPVETEVDWIPLDSPTTAEWAAINLQKAQTAQIYAGLGAIDGMDIRDQLMNDKTSDFHGLAEIEEEEEVVEPTEEANGNPQAPASF